LTQRAIALSMFVHKPNEVSLMDLDKSQAERETVIFRFPRKGHFSPVPMRRKWEEEHGRLLQAIDRHEEGNEIVYVYVILRDT
jgi:hypothetical protein